MTPAVTVACADLGPGPGPEQLAARAAGRMPGLVCLRGRFAGGSAVLTSHPVDRVDTVPPDLPELPARTVDGVEVVAGGWFGVLGFDPGRTRFARHDHVVRLVDGRWRFEALVTDARAAALDAIRTQWQRLLAEPAGAPPEARTGPWRLPPRDSHLAAVETAIGLIRDGELYQVNVCTRLHAGFDGDPAALFATAALALDPAYGAFVQHGDGSAVAALSPELFWRRRGRTVTSAPIKGTVPVGPGQAARLRASVKDVAENVMIVDLVRNDLGRVCVPGTVRPVRLLEVAERVGVLHLVSEVTGELRPGVTDRDVVAALAPPASVTGTPKLRALQAIAALERVDRGAFTGAVGFTSPCWGSEYAVAIRTLEIDGTSVQLGVGGGVTVDSVPNLEWQEVLHKARPVVRAAGGSLPSPLPVEPLPSPLPVEPLPSPLPVEPLPSPVEWRVTGRVATYRSPLDSEVATRRDEEGEGCGVAAELGVFETVLVRDGRPLRLAEHLGRLAASVRELWDETVPADLTARVLAALATSPRGRAALRVTVRPGAAPEIALSATGSPPGPTPAVVGRRAEGLWRHKWADRRWAGAAPGTEQLYVAADGTVLESARGSVFLLRPDGTLVTPPLRPDLLPGVTRRALLDHARDHGRSVELRGFTTAELRTSVAFWTSSLSGAVPISRLDGVDLPRDDASVAALSQALLSTGGTAAHR